MTPQIIAQERLSNLRNLSAMRMVKLLVGTYLGLCVLTLAAIIFFRNNAAIVTIPVWVRGIIITASALLTVLFTAQTARGSSSGYLRLRLVSAIMCVAIVTLIMLPGLFPLWMKIEQGVCGLLLLGIVVIVNGKQLRSIFATR
jgi:hypothetical protein